MIILPLKSRLITNTNNLFEEILDSLKRNKEKISEKNIIVIASKVVSLTEGGKIALTKTLKEIINEEADQVLSNGPYALTVKNGVFMPNAGIDHSNTEKGTVILLPKNSQKSAEILRNKLKKYFKLKEVGVLICDSHCTPLRRGVTGLTLGISGFEPIDDLRGEKDLCGNTFEVSTRNLADQIASAALIVIGEGIEKIPFALIKDCPVRFTERRIKITELLIKKEECLFNTLYNKI